MGFSNAVFLRLFRAPSAIQTSGLYILPANSPLITPPTIPSKRPSHRLRPCALYARPPHAGCALQQPHNLPSHHSAHDKPQHLASSAQVAYNHSRHLDASNLPHPPQTPEKNPSTHPPHRNKPHHHKPTTPSSPRPYPQVHHQTRPSPSTSPP